METVTCDSTLLFVAGLTQNFRFVPVEAKLILKSKGGKGVLQDNLVLSTGLIM